MKRIAHLNVSFTLFFSIGFAAIVLRWCAEPTGDSKHFQPCSTLCSASGFNIIRIDKSGST
jgi:hypothetical protein